MYIVSLFHALSSCIVQIRRYCFHGQSNSQIGLGQIIHLGSLISIMALIIGIAATHCSVRGFLDAQMGRSSTFYRKAILKCSVFEKTLIASSYYLAEFEISTKG